MNRVYNMNNNFSKIGGASATNNNSVQFNGAKKTVGNTKSNSGYESSRKVDEIHKEMLKDHLLIMASQSVWVSDPQEGFILGHIVDLGSQAVSVILDGKGKRAKTGKAFEVSYESVYPAEDNSSQDYEDNCSLMYLNEATLLNNVRNRYEKNLIYTYIANMLVAVNPYVEIKGLYSPDTIKRYQGKSLGTLPPHVYAIADKSYRDLRVTKQSQSIIVSGESGSGKTESTKYILRFLCCGSSASSAGAIEQKILDANPVLESFGNAKTTRNNNSSRFGKFIEIHFEKYQKVVGGYISHYLLEKSRICSQAREERNYHIFYQLLRGAPPEIKKPIGLHGKRMEDFHYLRQGCTQFFGDTLKDPIVDDMKDFKTLERAFSQLGISDQERMSIFTTVASVLHLGNVCFEDDPDDSRGGCRVADKCDRTDLPLAASLMGVDPDDLRQALTSRVMQTAKGGIKGTVIMVPLKVHEANNARDALAKAMYSRLFDYIVLRINEAIPFASSKTTYIGVLDIAGFEFFTINSFEQFCINYCNEKLQQFFNERVLSDEQTLYEKEGLGVEKIEYIDNADCIELIENPKGGILFYLDEESKLPKPTAVHFTSEVHRQFSNHFRFAVPRKSKLKEHRDLRDEEGFIVRHFAGAVCYKTSLFIEKNNDALHASLEALAQHSGSKFVQTLFKQVEQQQGKLTYVSVASKFRTQLGELLEKLRNTGTSFIRCIKPNARMVPGVFEGGQILSQLQSAGMTSVLELMQKGYPSRVQFASLYSTYKEMLPAKLTKLDPRFFCRALFKAIGLSEQDFRFGLTRVFFRPGKFKEFDQIMRNDPESLKQMVAAVSKWIIQSKWKKMQYVVWSNIKLKNKIHYRAKNLLVIQKTVKMHLSRKQHRPRYKGIMSIRNLYSQIGSMGTAAEKLKKDRETSKKDIQKLQADLANGINTIKRNEKISEKEIGKIYQDLLSKCDALVKTISKRVEHEKNEEEREKARKIQEEMERQKREKEEQEKAKKLEEEAKKKKQEMEERRKKEEIAMEARRKKDMEQRKKLDEENDANRMATEQEKRDYEMAYRLAQETNATVDDHNANNTTQQQQPLLKRSNYVVNSLAAKKYDLSAWKYSELRDTINTSCDVELLEACREEFHRRLKVYHAWKVRNRSNQGISKDAEVMNERAPKSVYQYQQSYPLPSSPSPTGAPTQRYFRIPFVKGQNKGLWYAHFDGQYIARQMEIHSGKEPTLLVAGRDDMQMCELRLNETGLTRKRGAEILDYDFEREWTKHGGEPYIRPADRASNANR